MTASKTQERVTEFIDPHPQHIALVTGATRGIGLAIARDLARTHRLILGGRNPQDVQALIAELQELVGESGDEGNSGNTGKLQRFTAFTCDLNDYDEVSELVSSLSINELDVLVLSAGVSEGGSVAQTPITTWERVMQINVLSQVNLINLLLPALRAARGQVVAINSGSGLTSHANNGAYCASKFALRAITDALREEERGTVRVSSVHPGRVDTDMQREIQAELGNEYDGSKYVRPESIAAAVRTVVDASEECTVETVQVRPVQAG